MHDWKTVPKGTKLCNISLSKQYNEKINVFQLKGLPSKYQSSVEVVEDPMICVMKDLSQTMMLPV